MTGRTGGFLQEKSSSTLISPTVVSLCNELSLLEFLPDYAHSPVLSDIFLKIVVISRRINPIQPTLLEKAMAPYSSTLAWKIPWMEEPGGLQSMGSLESGTTERLHFHFSLSCMEKEMATHSSVLAWRIPGTAEPHGLPSMGSHGVGHD